MRERGFAHPYIPALPPYHSGERGRARPEVLQGLLGTCERVVQEVDSVEYGLTDIQVWGGEGGASMYGVLTGPL